MPLDGHSYLVSQGWSGHGTGLRQDSIIRPLAIPQKRTLAGLGNDRDEAFPFWDHVFSIAAKSIQVKLYQDDEDDSDAEATPRQTSLDITTTGILSNKPPKLGSSAISTMASSTSNSGVNTPTTSIIPHSLASPSSNLLVAAKKESARRTLYSRFFRGPVLGPDSDSSDSCLGVSGSDPNAMRKTRDGVEDPDWSSNLNQGVKSGSRTPMAIAKSRLTSVSEAVIPSKKGIEKAKGEEPKKMKKRKRKDEEEAEVKRQETEREDRRKKDKKEKKKKEGEEKRDKKDKKKVKRDEKETSNEKEQMGKEYEKDEHPKTAASDECPSLENLRSHQLRKQTVELNEAPTNFDKQKPVPSRRNGDIRNDKSEEKSKKRKEKEGRPDTTADPEKRRRERKQKRDRQEAEKKTAAVLPQVTGADGGGLEDPGITSVYSPMEGDEDFRSESKKKKKRKRDE